MRYGSSQVTTNGSMSGTFFSNGIDLQQEWGYSFQFIWTSTSSASQAGLGTMKVQVSNDNVQYPPSGPAGTDPAANVRNWCDITSTLTSTSLTTGTSQLVMNIYPSLNRWARAAFVAASG